MNYSKIKEKICSVELSDEAKERIIKNCENQVYEKEKKNMKIKEAKLIKKPAIILGIFLICICIPITCMAVTHTGLFKDIKDSDGSIIGTEYESGEGEINVSTDTNNKILEIVISFDKEISPYKYQESISLGEYEIHDEFGNVILKNIGEEFADVNSDVKFTLDLEGLDSGEYKLIINSIIGAKKADQNLKITGNWECKFTL